MNTNPGRRIAVILVVAFAISFAAAQDQRMSPPPLVPCDAAAEGMPCVEIVKEVGDIVGIWRRYTQNLTTMGFAEYRNDGTVSILTFLPSDGRVTATIRFEDGVASIAANPDGPAPRECVAPGMYELRLIRFGEHPVALHFSRLSEDRCTLRANEYTRPMVFYGGSGEDLRMVNSVPALAQPLVPCPEDVLEPYPCDVVVTRSEDASGIWKQYVSRPDLRAPNGMGYQRIDADGRFVIADTPENTRTAFENYPYGTYAFQDGQAWLTVDAPDVSETCETARQRLYVYRYGAQPVALLVVPLLDRCPPRLQDTRLPLIWVADAQ